MPRKSSFYIARFALLAWLFAGLAAVTSNVALESAQDLSVSQVLADAHDGPDSMGPDQLGDTAAVLQLAFGFAHSGGTVIADYETGQPGFSNAPRKSWHGRAPPTA